METVEVKELECCNVILDEDGNVIDPGIPDNSLPPNCTPTDETGNIRCPTKNTGSCSLYSLFDIGENKDNCYIDGVVDESLKIAGAPLNIYRLLGVHEQCRLIDQTGNGNAISGGDGNSYPAENVFDIYDNEWRSCQRGTGVTKMSYIGYDFGVVMRTDGSYRRYGSEVSVYKDISTISIKQGANTSNRASRVRIERSDDGITWYGAAILNLPDDGELHCIAFRNSAPHRYWRLRPVAFNGGENDYWVVKALELSEYESTRITNIEDKIWLENRDRDYAEEAIQVKGYYDLLDTQTDLSRFGIELPSENFYILANFSAMVRALGRPLVIGDIMEIPSEKQYNTAMEPKLKYVEVVDIGWSTEGYAPGWKPLLIRIIAQQMIASQETQDIFGGLTDEPDETGLVNIDDGQHPFFQDYSDISKTIENEAADRLNQRGAEGSDAIRWFSDEEREQAFEDGVENLQKIGLHAYTGTYGDLPGSLYVEDAMPPNNAPYSEGDLYPTNPNDGDYHRLTYSTLSTDIPARLYRFSVVKGRWVFLEHDRRAAFENTKPILQEYLKAAGATQPQDITNENEEDC